MKCSLLPCLFPSRTLKKRGKGRGWGLGGGNQGDHHAGDDNFAVQANTSCCCVNIKGSRPEWCISSMIYSGDTPFWSETLDYVMMKCSLLLCLCSPAEFRRRGISAAVVPLKKKQKLDHLCLFPCCGGLMSSYPMPALSRSGREFPKTCRWMDTKKRC